jgi:hypothetical protein
MINDVTRRMLRLCGFMTLGAVSNALLIGYNFLNKDVDNKGMTFYSRTETHNLYVKQPL